MRQMKTSIEEQSVSVLKDLSHWEQYTLEASEVRPWVEAAEVRTAWAVSRPTSVTEMQSLLDATKRLQDECKNQLIKLQTMAMHCQQMSQQSSAREEIDALHARWNGVNDAVANQLHRLDDLHRTWTHVIDKV